MATSLVGKEKMGEAEVSEIPLTPEQGLRAIDRARTAGETN